MQQSKIVVSLAVALFASSLTACPSPDFGCPVNQREVDGVCKRICNNSDECESGESCEGTENVCVSMDGGVAGPDGGPGSLTDGGPDGRDAGPAAPLPPPNAAVLSGGGIRSTKKFRLRLSVGTAQPTGSASNASRRLNIGIGVSP